MRKIWILFIAFMPLFALAQENPKKETKIDDNYNPGVKVNGKKNVIKFAPLSFISGNFPLMYERRIGKFFSVQLAAGATHRNYSRSVFATISDPKINYPYDLAYNFYDRTDMIYDFNTRDAKLGYSFSVQPKLYFNNKAPEGAYLSMSYDFYRYNFAIPGIVRDSIGGANPIISYRHKGAIKKEHENISDMMVYFGYQDFYDQLTVDYVIGIGIRSVVGSKYYYLTDETNYPVVNTYEGNASYKQSTANFNIGVRIGYHF